jgi:hypothetical protein
MLVMKVGTPKLSLDHDERDVLVRHLDGVRVPELMWCEPTPDAGFGGRMMQLFARSRRLPTAGR